MMRLQQPPSNKALLFSLTYKYLWDPFAHVGFSSFTWGKKRTKSLGNLACFWSRQSSINLGVVLNRGIFIIEILLWSVTPTAITC